MERLKTYALLAFLTFSLGLAWYVLHLRKQLAICNRPRPALPTAGTAASPAVVPIVDTYTDAAGNQHAVIADEQTQHLIRSEALQITAPFRRVIDSLSQALAVKPKDIEGYTAVQLKMARDTIRFLSRTVSASGITSRTFQDPYLTLTVREPADKTNADSLGDFDLQYNADLKFVEYSKQKRFLGIPVSRKKYYTDISSNDPRVKIKGVDKFTIQRSEPVLGVRVQAISTYNFETESWGAGVGTRFDVGESFNLGVNYIYNFNLQRWVPAAYAKYDILQIGR
jgi:hypothetical protein